MTKEIKMTPERTATYYRGLQAQAEDEQRIERVERERRCQDVRVMTYDAALGEGRN